MTYSSPSCSYCETSTMELTSRSEPILCSLIDNLIKSREYIVSELYLGNSSMSDSCQSNCKSCNSLFRERSIKNSVNTILLQKPLSASKNTSKFHILPKYFCTRLIQFYVESVARAISIAELID